MSDHQAYRVLFFFFLKIAYRVLMNNYLFELQHKTIYLNVVNQNGCNTFIKKKIIIVVRWIGIVVTWDNIRLEFFALVVNHCPHQFQWSSLKCFQKTLSYLHFCLDMCISHYVSWGCFRLAFSYRLLLVIHKRQVVSTKR